MQTFLGITVILLISLLFLALSLVIIESIKAFFISLHRDKDLEYLRFPVHGNLDKVSHWYLYILKLEHDKYYVGITSRTPEIRMQEHINGKHSAYWTAKYKPLQIIHTEDLGYITRRKAEKTENKMTRYCMRDRGLNNVRGGDLRSTEDYIQRFGYIFFKDGWEDITIVALLLAIIAYLLVDKFFL